MPAAAPFHLPPDQAGKRPELPRGLPAERTPVAQTTSGLLAAVPPGASLQRRTQSPAADLPRPEATSPKACQQHLSFRPKTLSCNRLGCGLTAESTCKQHLSSHASLGSGSTSADAPATNPSCKQHPSGAVSDSAG